MNSKILAGMALAIGASPADAADVNLSASLINSCVLSLGSSGTMTVSSSGTVLSSENSGGSQASLTLVAIGTSPTISFAAPSLTASPAGWSASPTVEVKYTSTGGANQAYTASNSSAALSGLTDSFAIHGRVTSSAGFAAGAYNLRTVATCSQ